MDDYNRLIDELIAVRENIKDYADVETIKYQRTTYDTFKGKTSYSVWRILVDESRTQWCVRDNVGFKSIKKAPNDQVVYAPVELKKILLCKSKTDRMVATTALDQIAKKKYESKE